MSEETRWLGILVVIAVTLVILVATYPAQKRHWAEQAEKDRLWRLRRRREDRHSDPDSTDDQLALLQRHGIEADAQRLLDQGVDLTALGYRPPDRP